MQTFSQSVSEYLHHSRKKPHLFFSSNSSFPLKSRTPRTSATANLISVHPFWTLTVNESCDVWSLGTGFFAVAPCCEGPSAWFVRYRYFFCWQITFRCVDSARLPYLFLGRCHSRAVTSKAAWKLVYKVSHRRVLSFPLGLCLEVESLSHAVAHLSFWGSARLLFKKKTDCDAVFLLSVRKADKVVRVYVINL